jgi:hypothetical protein
MSDVTYSRAMIVLLNMSDYTWGIQLGRESVYFVMEGHDCAGGLPRAPESHK